MKWLNKTKAVQYMNGKIGLASETVSKDLQRFSKLMSDRIHGLPLFEKPSDLVYHIQKLYMDEIGYGEVFVNTDNYPNVDIHITIFDKEVESNVSMELELSIGYYNKSPEDKIHYYKDSSYYRNYKNEDLFDKVKSLNKFIQKEIFDVWHLIMHTKKINGKIDYSSYRHELQLNSFEYNYSNRDDFFKIHLKNISSDRDLKQDLKHNINILINSKRLLKALNELEEPIVKNSEFSKLFDSLEFVDAWTDSETIEWDVYSF